MDAVSFSRIAAPALIEAPNSSRPGDAPATFAGLLDEAVGRLRELQKDSDQELLKLLSGEPVELHRVMLAGEKAALASQLMMSIRNKVVDAYQEVMRMQV